MLKLPLGNFACFNCRKTFSRPYEKGKWTRTCPICKGNELYLGTKWKAPRMKDKSQWEIIELFIKSGKGLVLWDEHLSRIPFPSSLAKARILLSQMQNWEKERLIKIRIDESEKGKTVKQNKKRILKNEKKVAAKNPKRK